MNKIEVKVTVEFEAEHWEDTKTFEGYFEDWVRSRLGKFQDSARGLGKVKVEEVTAHWSISSNESRKKMSKGEEEDMERRQMMRRG